MTPTEAISLGVILFCAWTTIALLRLTTREIASGQEAWDEDWDDEDEQDEAWLLVESEDGEQAYMSHRDWDWSCAAEFRVVACGLSAHSDHDVVPVETGGEIVAHLCVTCDKQLDANWRP